MEAARVPRTKHLVDPIRKGISCPQRYPYPSHPPAPQRKAAMMSFEGMLWAAKQRGMKPVTNYVLLILAEMANDEGYCDAGQDKVAWRVQMSTRSLREHLKQLEAVGLIHRERRVPSWADHGRPVDTIALHIGTYLPGSMGARYPGQDEIDRQKRASRRRLEVPFGAEDRNTPPNVPPSQRVPEDSSGTGVGHNVPPSQPVPEESSGTRSNRKISVGLPEDQRHSTPSALIGTARPDLIQSSPVLSSPEDEPTADAVETGPDMTGPDTTPTSTTTEQAERGPSVAGVPVRLLRWKTRPVLDQVEDQVIEEMIRIVMSRYDAVRSPLGLMITAVRNDDGQDLIEEATARVAAASEAPWGPAWMSPSAVDREWAEMLQQTRDREAAEAARPRPCPTHNVDFVGPECPSCRADRLAGAYPAPAESAAPHTPGGGVDGAELRRRLRAQRAARVGGDR